MSYITCDIVYDEINISGVSQWYKSTVKGHISFKVGGDRGIKRDRCRHDSLQRTMFVPQK